MRIPPALAITLLAVFLACCFSSPIFAQGSGFGAKLTPLDQTEANSFSGYAVSGVGIEEVDAGGLADFLGLKRSDVVIEVNGVRTLTADDLLSAVHAQSETNSITFARAGRKEMLTIYSVAPEQASAVSSSSGRILLLAPAAQIDDPDDPVTAALRQSGMPFDTSVQVPTSLARYTAVVISDPRAANTDLADRLKLYLRKGGGVVLCGPVPVYLDGNNDSNNDWSGNFRHISDWFGYASFASNGIRGGNDVARLSASRPLGTDLHSSDEVFSFNGAYTEFGVPDNGADEFDVPVAEWQEHWWGSSWCAAFYRRFGSGRVYWQWSPYETNYPDVENLFIAGCKWAAGVVSSDSAADQSGGDNGSPQRSADDSAGQSHNDGQQNSHHSNGVGQFLTQLLGKVLQGSKN